MDTNDRQFAGFSPSKIGDSPTMVRSTDDKTECRTFVVFRPRHAPKIVYSRSFAVFHTCSFAVFFVLFAIFCGYPV